MMHDLCVCVRREEKAAFQEVIEGPSHSRRQSWECEGGWAGKFGQREEAMKDMCGHSQKTQARSCTHTHTHWLLYYYCTNSGSQMWAVYTALISSDSAPTSAEQLHQHTHIDTHKEMYTLTSSRLELAIFRYDLGSVM